MPIVSGLASVGFFYDDNATSTEYSNGGNMYRARIWDEALDSTQFAAAFSDTPPRAIVTPGSTEEAAPDDVPTRQEPVINAIVGTNRGGRTKGRDILVGTDGIEHINGKGKRDFITGGLGADRLTGGLGRDVFIYNSVDESTPLNRDTITDFRNRRDKIDLRNIDANTGLDGDQKFRYIRGNEFTGLAGQLRFANNVLEADVNGDGNSDFAVFLQGVNRLSAGSIIL